MKGEQHGSAVLMTMILATTLSLAATAILDASMQLVLETKAHEQVTCARYAARSGLALAPRPVAGPRAKAILGGHVDTIEVRVARELGGRCLATADAVCGDARRVATLTLVGDDAAACR